MVTFSNIVTFNSHNSSLVSSFRDEEMEAYKDYIIWPILGS